MGTDQPLKNDGVNGENIDVPSVPVDGMPTETRTRVSSLQRSFDFPMT